MNHQHLYTYKNSSCACFLKYMTALIERLKTSIGFQSPENYFSVLLLCHSILWMDDSLIELVHFAIFLFPVVFKLAKRSYLKQFKFKKILTIIKWFKLFYITENKFKNKTKVKSKKIKQKWWGHILDSAINIRVIMSNS